MVLICFIRFCILSNLQFSTYFSLLCTVQCVRSSFFPHMFVTCQVQFSHVTTCNSPAMSRRPAAAVSSPALPRAVAAARGSNLQAQAARGSPHVRRKFAVNNSVKGASHASDYQVIYLKFVYLKIVFLFLSFA